MGEFRIDVRGQQAHSFAPCEHIHDAELDNASRALALLAQQRRRDSKPAAQMRLDEFLPVQPPPVRDLYALHECLVYNILQKAFLARYVKRQDTGANADGVAAERRRV
ncbi:hypothetical protein EDB85DRAFT_2144593 [Lactarius pseudohatsudake]|nr:hypothetical protein EDB85DRAFT_2144593 [Lactarius pseudohatsudake]